MTRLFEKYGEVEKCNIMRDPHSGDSRGFGFVKMVSAEAADAAREGLQGQMYEGRSLSIEKARRGRPRTPTPGKYYGPPKRGKLPSENSSSRRRITNTPPPETRFRGGRYGDRYDERRGGGGLGRRDDPAGGYRGGSRYRDRYDDRDYYGSSSRYGAGYRDREDYGRGVDRYASGPPAREDRYGGRGDERRGYYGGREERSYNEAPPREPAREAFASGSRYDDRGEYHSRNNHWTHPSDGPQTRSGFNDPIPPWLHPADLPHQFGRKY